MFGTKLTNSILYPSTWSLKSYNQGILFSTLLFSMKTRNSRSKSTTWSMLKSSLAVKPVSNPLVQDGKMAAFKSLTLTNLFQETITQSSGITSRSTHGLKVFVDHGALSILGFILKLPGLQVKSQSLMKMRKMTLMLLILMERMGHSQTYSILGKETMVS